MNRAKEIYYIGSYAIHSENIVHINIYVLHSSMKMLDSKLLETQRKNVRIPIELEDVNIFTLTPFYSGKQGIYKLGDWQIA